MGILKDKQKKKLKNFVYTNLSNYNTRKIYHYPEMQDDVIFLPKFQNIQVFKQEKYASCGPSILKSAFGYMIENTKGLSNQEKEKLQETDFYQHSELAKITVKIAGIPPKILMKGIQQQIEKYNLPYFPIIRKNLTYKDIKQELRDETLMIFSHMGNANLHPSQLGKPLPKREINDLHYFLLLGIDEVNDKVLIADPHGTQNLLSVHEFRERISLEKKYLRSRGGIYRAGVKLKVIPIRMAIMLRKYPNT